jgi:hypothetical protein
MVRQPSLVDIQTSDYRFSGSLIEIDALPILAAGRS